MQREIFRSKTGTDGNYFTPLQGALFRLPFKGYVTTNFDPGLLEARYRLRPDSRPTGFGTSRDTDVVARWQNGDVFSEQQCPILFAHGIYERRDTIENENDAFRIGRSTIFVIGHGILSTSRRCPLWPEPARVHRRYVRIASKREPQMHQSSRSPLDWGVLVCEGAGDASRCGSYGLWDWGGVAVMAHCNFSYRFSFGFGLMATCFHGRLKRDSRLEG